jgi:hypothetical protein
MYLGSQNWKSEIQKYSGIRQVHSFFHKADYLNLLGSHPNFLQLYGAVSSSGLYAMIFHDGWCLCLDLKYHLVQLSELVPYADYMFEHPLPPMLTLYRLGCIVCHWSCFSGHRLVNLGTGSRRSSKIKPSGALQIYHLLVLAGCRRL